MTVALMDVGDAIEQVRPWLTPVFLLGILGVLSRHWLGARRLDVDAEGAARDAYATAVRGFREEVTALKEEHGRDRAEWERRHNECEKARDDFKEKVEALRDLVAGLNRVIVSASASRVLELGDYPSEEVRRAAERVDILFRSKQHGTPSGQNR